MTKRIVPDFSLAAGGDTHSVLSRVLRAGEYLYENQNVSGLMSTAKNAVGSALWGKKTETNTQTAPKTEWESDSLDDLIEPIVLVSSYEERRGLSDSNRLHSAAANRRLKNKTQRYQAIRVLFLSWQCFDSPATKKLMERLKELLGMTYNYHVHEFTIPSHVETPEATLIHYLAKNNFFSLQDEDNDRELLIIIYDGLAGVIQDRFCVFGHKGIMNWSWISKKIAAAPYDSLVVMNSNFIPYKGIRNEHELGTNMVLAACGPTSHLRERLLRERMTTPDSESNIPDETNLLSVEVDNLSWSKVFLGTFLAQLKSVESSTDASSPLSVTDIFHEILVAHRTCGFGQGLNGTPTWKPFCDFVDGIERLDDLSIYIQPQVKDHNASEQHGDEWTLVGGEDEFG
ncbi:hypothetical protein B0T19DRAFT_480863 [Cercophora scortea]|uniref:Uncharacterized protein n=1 Tax=Cercophora scortea TaxID=314031 RepID=A0AAE0J4D6_9PEZI|nr:hypothetical protein B0T19DRAFT_480863 [Cercophora scortea]